MGNTLADGCRTPMRPLRSMDDSATMTTATTLFNNALLALAVRGDRPRCSDTVDHARWTSEHPADRATAAAWCNGCEVLQLCGAAADHKNRALDFRLRRPHVVTRRIWPRVTTTQEFALCNTSRTIRFQERRL